MTKPDFFIVGAPKCGTTSMHDYLSQHPEIFMSEVKEPHFFGSDLVFLDDRPYRNREAYFSLFSHADRKRIGESSVWYLYSRKAAEEIHEFNPEAKIMIMLRNPVDMIYSLHGHLLFYGIEFIPDFSAALAAEPRRRAGQQPAVKKGMSRATLYREIARYAEQAQRYFDFFGRDKTLVLIYDDLRRDPLAVYRRALDFLEVDAAFIPQLSLKNPRKRPRSAAINSLLRNPPSWSRPLIRAYRQLPVRIKGRTILRLNTEEMPGSKMEPTLRRKLVQEFAPEVEKLAAMIDTDLSAWTRE
jgi:hypothetical protein